MFDWSATNLADATALVAGDAGSSMGMVMAMRPATMAAMRPDTMAAMALASASVSVRLA